MSFFNNLKYQKMILTNVQSFLNDLKKDQYVNLSIDSLSNFVYNPNFIDNIIGNSFDKPVCISLKRMPNNQFEIVSGLSELANLAFFLSFNKESELNCFDHYVATFYSKELQSEYNNLADLDKANVIFSFMNFNFVLTIVE